VKSRATENPEERDTSSFVKIRIDPKTFESIYKIVSKMTLAEDKEKIKFKKFIRLLPNGLSI
jgi:hypothetical protein